MTKKKDIFNRSSFDFGKIIDISEVGNIVPQKSDCHDALLIKSELGYQIIPRVPDVKKLYIEATTRCNFDCITCIRNSWEEELTHMEWAVFESIFEGIPELPQLNKVHFGGFGEPFSHPRILDMFRLIKEKDLKAEVITNGSLLSEDVINQLIDIKLDKIFVSLDGPDEEEYTNIRQGANFFEVINNLKQLKEIKARRKTKYPELGIEFVATKDNFHKLPELARLASELGAVKIIITNVLPYSEDMKDQVLYDMDDKDVPFAKDSVLLMLNAQLPYMKLRTDRYCRFVEDKSMVITDKGLVVPCYALMHRHNCYIYDRLKEMYPFYLGDVRETSLKRIWMDPVYINFRQAVKYFHFPSCTDCLYVEGCSYTDNNEGDCWGNSPSCADCLWSRQIIACP